MKGSIKVIIFYVILIAVLIVAITSILGNANNDNYTYGEIVELFTSEQVKKCYVGNDNILYSSFTVIKRLLSSSSLSAMRVVSSAHLR